METVSSPLPFLYLEKFWWHHLIQELSSLYQARNQLAPLITHLQASLAHLQYLQYTEAQPKGQLSAGYVHSNS